MYFIDGCIVVVVVERYLFYRLFIIYKDECLKIVVDINFYIRNIFIVNVLFSCVIGFIYR